MAIKLSKSRKKSIHVGLLQPFELCPQLHFCDICSSIWPSRLHLKAGRSCAFTIHRDFHMGARLVWGWFAARDAQRCKRARLDLNQGMARAPVLPTSSRDHRSLLADSSTTSNKTSLRLVASETSN